LLAVILLLVLGGVIATYYLERFSIASGSMEPALEVGEVVWAVRRFQPIERGQVVAFEPSAGDILVKRVIGMPGERIEAVDGQLLVDRGTLNEAVWIDQPQPTETFGPVELGPDQYFVMGDNRAQSIDSRHFGPVALDELTYIINDR
jgi:signal peptidase I